MPDELTEKAVKAVVFGANGQDGVYLAELLKMHGVQVFGFSRSNRGDVSDYATVERVIRDIRPDFLFHLAASSTTRHEALFANHATISTGSLNVLEAVRLHAPECRVFITGSGVQFVNVGNPISERDPFEATSPYAVARIQSVYAARYYRTFGIKAYVGYLFHHESPLRKESHLCKLIADAVKRIANGADERIRVRDVSVRKEAAFAGDVVEGIWTLVNQEAIFESAIGTGVAYSVQDWLDICFRQIGRDWRDFVDVGSCDEESEYKILVSDPATIFSLGWKPVVGIEQLASMMIS
jgi:GDP-D-mannose dehydratase